MARYQAQIDEIDRSLEASLVEYINNDGDVVDSSTAGAVKVIKRDLMYCWSICPAFTAVSACYPSGWRTTDYGSLDADVLVGRCRSRRGLEVADDA